MGADARVADREVARRDLPTVVGLVLLVAVGLLLADAVSDGPARGRQAGVVDAHVERAAAVGWVLMEHEAGDLRAGWPRPMAWVGRDRLCFGFERVDFPEPMPSLARCVGRDDVSAQGAASFHLVGNVLSGDDRWFFLWFGDEVHRIDVDLVAGDELDGDRIHRAGGMAVLRLSRRDPIAAITWLTGSRWARCDAAADAWETAELCRPDPAS